jgi:hypothetical protein
MINGNGSNGTIKLSEDTLIEARMLRDRKRAALERLGDADLSIAKLESQRMQLREVAAREDAELTACLARGLAKVGAESRGAMIDLDKGTVVQAPAPRPLFPRQA